MLRITLAAIGGSLLALPVFAQVVPVQTPYGPYNPYYNPYGGAYGNALSGAADLNRSYGDNTKAIEDARILREKANQAKLDTQKQAFDQMLYEQSKTPSYTEKLTKNQTLILNRMINQPEKAEITGGKTLNTMLPYLQFLSSTGAMGPPVAVPQSIVNQLNISTGGGTSVGMLRDGGHLDWPLGLRGDHQEKLDKLLPAAVEGTAKGTLTPKQLKAVRTEMNAMREDLRQACGNDEIETSTYLTALRFYNSLLPAVEALESPDAKKQLAGSTAPRARNVQELCDYMTDNGVKFAAASPGNEAAYQVVHDAFVRYIRQSQVSNGFMAVHAPVNPPSMKK